MILVIMLQTKQEIKKSGYRVYLQDYKNNKNDLNQNRVALNTEKTQRVSHVL